MLALLGSGSSGLEEALVVAESGLLAPPVMTEKPVLMRESMCCLNLMNGFLDGDSSSDMLS